jgi:NAD+ kinase
VVEKVASQHAVRLNCTIDGDHLVTYRADGVIVATPTGSTAYAYSAGGPVIDPGVSALIIVPVAPHNLFSRPVVVGPDSVIELEVLAGRSVRVNVDGHECGEVGDGLTLRLRRGDRPARLVSFLDGGFASRVASNLGIPGE